MSGKKILEGNQVDNQVLQQLKNQGFIKNTSEYVIEEDFPGTKIITDGTHEVGTIHENTTL